GGGSRSAASASTRGASIRPCPASHRSPGEVEGLQNLLPMGNKHMRRPCFGKVSHGAPHLTQRPAEHGVVGSVGGAFLPDGLQLCLELHALGRGEGEFP